MNTAPQTFDAATAPATGHSGGGHSGRNPAAALSSTPSAVAGRVDSIQELAQLRADLARMEGVPAIDDREVMRLRRSFVDGLRVRIRIEEGGCVCRHRPATF